MILAALLLNAVFNFGIGLVTARYLGPDEFGRFALAVALAVAVQVIVFDWIRLAAIRFYSDATRRDAPNVRATLNASYGAATILLACGGFALFGLGAFASLSPDLFALALVTAVINGMFDYSTGLLRASFRDRLYARLVIVKNVLALCLTVGGAVLFHSAPMAIVGGVLSLGGAVALLRASLADEGSGLRAASWPLARLYLGYAAPIVVANLLYLLIPLVNRAIVTHLFGFAETGQFSLAWDFGQRSLQAIGTALDVVLFQVAVAIHAREGLAAARLQTSKNLGLVIALRLPATLGLWLILPSVEVLVVPPEFRGPFGHYLTLLLPGLFALSVASYGVNPAFQIEKKTLALILAAIVGCAGTPLFLLFMPAGDDASGLALAQSAAYGAAVLVLLVFAAVHAGLRPPPARDLLAAFGGSPAMVATGLRGGCLPARNRARCRARWAASFRGAWRRPSILADCARPCWLGCAAWTRPWPRPRFCAR